MPRGLTVPAYTPQSGWEQTLEADDIPTGNSHTQHVSEKLCKSNFPLTKTLQRKK